MHYTRQVPVGINSVHGTPSNVRFVVRVAPIVM